MANRPTWRARWFAIGVTAALATACGSGESITTVATANTAATMGEPRALAPAPICSPGAEMPCTGPAGCAGEQTCREDGAAYGACYCRSDCAPGEALVYVIATTNVL